MANKLALIALGGAIGSVLRYLIQGWAQAKTDGSFPVGTLVVNVSGCLVFGVLYAAFLGKFLVDENIRLAVLVGVMGGYTTFSAFGLETFKLAADGQLARAFANVLLSNTLGLIAMWLGVRAGERCFGG